MTARLLLDIETLPAELQEAVAQFASPLNGSDLRHLVSIVESYDEEEIQERHEEIVQKAEQRDEWRARMQRATTGAEPLPALGAYPRSHRPESTRGPDEWLQEDPRRVGLVAREMVRLDGTLDDDALVAILKRAESLGLDSSMVIEALSEEVVA